MTTTSPATIAFAPTAAKHSSSESNTRAGPRCRRRSWPDELHDRAFARKVAAQHGEPAGLLQRPVDRDDDLLSRRLDCTASAISASVRPSTFSAEPSTRPALEQLARDESDAAGAMEVGGDEASARLEIGDDRRARRDLVEVVELERQAELARDREQVEDARSSSRRWRRPRRSHSRSTRA